MSGEYVRLEDYERLRSTLKEAALQIEYLHEEFQETDSGNALLSRIKEVLWG
jgi:hypothetical protein